MDEAIKILSHWGLSGVTVSSIPSPSQSTWDVGGQYILKRNSDADSLSYSIRLSKLLIQEGIPAAAYIPANDGQFTTPDGLYCLMTKIPGEHPDFYKEPNLAAVMGRELARLHIALANIEPQGAVYDSDLLSDWRDKIKPILNGMVESTIIDNIDARFAGIYPNLPRQLIHRDVHCHNIMFENGKLTGWLDFDIGQKNVRSFDIAYLLCGLLIGNINDAAKIEVWHMIYQNLISGYEEINALSDDEHKALPVLMIVIEFLFVSFWIGRKNTEQSGIALALAKWLHHGTSGTPSHTKNILMLG